MDAGVNPTDVLLFALILALLAAGALDRWLDGYHERAAMVAALREISTGKTSVEFLLIRGMNGAAPYLRNALVRKGLLKVWHSKSHSGMRALQCRITPEGSAWLRERS